MPLDRASTLSEVELLLPDIRCAGCIGPVERTLAAIPGVLEARVNLTAKRARVRLEPGQVEAEQLVAALGEAGFSARPFDRNVDGGQAADHTARDLLLRIGVAGFAAMNVMLLSISVWSGAEAATRDLLHWISGLIALPAMAYAGLPFYRSAASALAGARVNMDVPITLAIALSALSSLIETARGGEHAYFDAGIMLIFFLLVGRYLEHRTRAGARTAAAELSALAGRQAMRRDADGGRRLVAVDELAPGEIIEIAAGERIPADGIVIDGTSDLDRSLVTGESRAEPVLAGETVNAGMVNLTGPLAIRITATGDRTLLAEIARMVDAAERGRTRYDKLADRAARIYAPGVHIVALLAFVGWLGAGAEWHGALMIAAAVLIITCPCALALAIPTVHTVATGRLFRTGIFLKDGAELERLAEVDLVAFDKTGTLTDGKPELIEGPAEKSPAWPVAAALTAGSLHPLSKAIAARAETLGVAPAEVSEIREIPGFGIEGDLQGTPVRLGRPEWAGATPGADGVVLRTGDAVHGFKFRDRPRPDMSEAAQTLRGLGLEMAILSGDKRAHVDAIGDTAGIARRHGDLAPGEKLRLLQDWAAEGRRVLMVGDGLNDAPALSAAHASMSPGSASDVARSAAGLVFTGANLAPVAEAIRVARAARRRAFESFGIAAVYNSIAIPLAVMGFVTPLIAALAMSGSSLLVVLNALRVRSAR
ncbi:MAG: heavy metal translocating P-type ATPase [Paracoccaceae bacterium]|nr:heavy metal translocating P-type ATPase [Paracoccaceae bacterium]